MRIRIVTSFPIKNDEYWKFIHQTRKAGIPIDGKEFIEKGMFIFESEIGNGIVKTQYVLEDDGGGENFVQQKKR